MPIVKPNYSTVARQEDTSVPYFISFNLMQHKSSNFLQNEDRYVFNTDITLAKRYFSSWGIIMWLRSHLFNSFTARAIWQHDRQCKWILSLSESLSVQKYQMSLSQWVTISINTIPFKLSLAWYGNCYVPSGLVNMQHHVNTKHFRQALRFTCL